MWYRPLNEEYAAELLLAGQMAPAGIYRETGSGRLVHLTMTDILPPSFDGRIACYVPIKTWAQILKGSPSSHTGDELAQSC